MQDSKSLTYDPRSIFSNEYLGKVEQLWQVTLKSLDSKVSLEMVITALWPRTLGLKVLSLMRRGSEAQSLTSQYFILWAAETEGDKYTFCLIGVCYTSPVHMSCFRVEGWDWSKVLWDHTHVQSQETVKSMGRQSMGFVYSFRLTARSNKTSLYKSIRNLPNSTRTEEQIWVFLTGYILGPRICV